jgi:hypothetical protein
MFHIHNENTTASRYELDGLARGRGDRGQQPVGAVPRGLGLPQLGRVEGTIRPTADSDIRFELWLPPASAWNSKYEGSGNGGFAGSIQYEPMSWALEAGYAVSGTDTGHVGSAVDARWAPGHPEKVVDFGWRAIHETAATSKAVVQAYYGRTPLHAYFSGCSDGGREALMEAQRFPEDYDGIVAVAPANFWTQVLPTAIWNEQALVAEPGGALTAGDHYRGAGRLPRRGRHTRQPESVPLRPLGPAMQGGGVRRLSDRPADHHPAENLFRAARRCRQFGLSRFRAGWRG